MTLWQIDATDLDHLLVDAPTFARALARDLGRRLRAAELSLATG
jgi:CRP-like cAMP-binding protein